MLYWFHSNRIERLLLHQLQYQIIYFFLWLYSHQQIILYQILYQLYLIVKKLLQQHLLYLYHQDKQQMMFHLMLKTLKFQHSQNHSNDRFYYFQLIHKFYLFHPYQVDYFLKYILIHHQHMMVVVQLVLYQYYLRLLLHQQYLFLKTL